MRGTFANRFRQALEMRGKKPADVSRETGIAKSSLSEYLKGKYEPKQDKIFLIAKSLSVNPGWLMGVDIEMNPATNTATHRIKVYGSIPASLVRKRS